MTFDSYQRKARTMTQTLRIHGLQRSYALSQSREQTLLGGALTQYLSGGTRKTKVDLMMH